MKTLITLFFFGTLLIVRAQEHGRGKGLVLTLYDQQDRIYGTSWDQKERTIYYYPYLVDRPFEDSLSNRYASQDVIDLYHRDPPRIIRREIDPSEMVPVTTKEIRNQFCFFVDLRNMTQAEQDSCQAFLKYFSEHQHPNEEVQVTYIDKDNVFYYTFVHNRIPVMGNDPAWIPRKAAGEILHADAARHIWKTVERRDGSFTHPVFSTLDPDPIIYIYLGRTADFNSPKQEMVNLNTVFRTKHNYLHYIDLSKGDSLLPFRQTAKLAGGLGMKFSWGKEVLTQTIINDLVVHYLWKEETEDTYNVSKEATVPAPQKPKPSIPQPVILGEPVKKNNPETRE
ncbi:MAG TPA: hypothetical protein VK151_13790 [Fluviicola sp.]|nr:hypothetical protein [Fluviicola sp.]